MLAANQFSSQNHHGLGFDLAIRVMHD